MRPLVDFIRAIRHPFGDKPGPATTAICPVCRTASLVLDSIEFNKNCEEVRGLKLPDSGERVRYHLCDQCGFCFAPEFQSWTFQDFERRIYNDDYATVDPDYKRIRPEGNAALLEHLFPISRPSHMDYGGGSGVLSAQLAARGWPSQTYDPFVNRDMQVESLGRFELVTAFEVFEHVPDIDALFAHLDSLVASDGLIVFSTLLSDGEISRGRPLTWWYAGPRNGHISLFSSNSLRICLAQHGFNLASADANLHLAYKTVPPWARHLLPAA